MGVALLLFGGPPILGALCGRTARTWPSTGLCRVIADGELFTTASKLASTVRCSGIVGVGVERCRWRPYSPPRCCRGAGVDLEPLSMVSVLASTPPNPTTLSVQRQRAEAVLDGCPFIHTLTQSIISDWLCSNSTP